MADHYDVVIVGGGVAGAMTAKSIGQRLKAKGRPRPRILILEAGPNDGWTWEGYRGYVDTFRAAAVKGPNSPYPAAANAPQTSVEGLTNWRNPKKGYLVQKGPLPFGSGYARQLGGTTLHWLGTCLRMLPNDFTLQSTYGWAVDWPIGYDDLRPFYERAEREIGVAGDVAEQYYPGVDPHDPKQRQAYWGDGYDFPMHKIPVSYLDQQLQDLVDGMQVRAATGEMVTLRLSSTPQGRNSRPRPGYTPVGAVGSPETGLRCEGNSSCVPICPVQAKYSALKTLASIDREHLADLEIRRQSVASLVHTDSTTGKVTGITYRPYERFDGPGGPPVTVTAEVYVIAAHAIETAKLLLASNVANTSDQVGRNLMDHPCLVTWGLVPENIGAYRGPGSTSGIPAFRDGPFRRLHAAFRTEIGNWGWTWPAFTPGSDVDWMIDSGNLFGRELRDALAAREPRQFRIAWEPEQLPEATNRVTIDPAYRDHLGNYRPVIHYDLPDYTKDAMLAAQQVNAQLFARAGVQDFTTYDTSEPGYFEYANQPLVFRGAGHVVGTHRMGTTERTSVVDKHQRSWDHRNLFLVGCGNFPTLATSNPTLTMSALALWAGDTIGDELAGGPPVGDAAQLAKSGAGAKGGRR